MTSLVAKPNGELLRRLNQLVFVQVGVLPLILALACTFFALQSTEFLSGDNIQNVARQSVYLVIVALAQMLALVVGGLDLSVGSVMALSSVIGATVMAAVFAAFPESAGLAIVTGMGAGVLAGILVGAFNGFGIAQFRVPPFMMTLGTSSIVFGLTLFITGGTPVYGMPPAFGEVFGFGSLLGVPVPVLFALVLIIALYLVMNWTRFGRHLYATGGNARAAELSGIRTGRILFASYLLIGLIGSIAGLLLTARLDTGEANLGADMPLQSIAACVIAGVSLSGGQGKVGSVVLGALFINLVQNGMNLVGIGAYTQTIILGVLLILAVMADRIRQRAILSTGVK
ncbi:D-allose transport system permease protein AlsC [compost metagenome]